MDTETDLIYDGIIEYAIRMAEKLAKKIPSFCDEFANLDSQGFFFLTNAPNNVHYLNGVDVGRNSLIKELMKRGFNVVKERALDEYKRPLEDCSSIWIRKE